MSARTVLIVEGAGSDSARLRRIARGAGFKILTTHPGSMIRSFVRRTRPDLILLPPQPSRRGSSEIARTIKEDPTTSDIPVMILVQERLSPAFFREYPTEACSSVEESDEALQGTMCLVAGRGTRLRYSRPKPLGPLEGHLLDDVLPEVLQFLFTTRKTGRVTIRNGSRWPGYIYIEDGSVVHAEHQEHEGIHAFRKLCFAAHGRFKFEPDARSAHRTLSEDGMELLLDTARRRDASRNARGGSAREERQRAYHHAVGSSFQTLSPRVEAESRASRFLRLTVLVAVTVIVVSGLFGAMSALRDRQQTDAKPLRSQTPAELQLSSSP